MFLQHGFQGQQNRTDHLPEQLILVREVIIYVPPTPTAPAISRMEVLEYPFCPNCCPATASMRPRMSSFNTCINNELCSVYLSTKVQYLKQAANPHL